MKSCSLIRQHILVAEDSESNYLLIEAILKHNYLTWVKTGKDAVALAKDNRYDIILMDLKMPIMNGIDATRAIRSFDKDTLIIAVTANAFDSDRDAAMQAGCNAFITKPINKMEFERLLESMIK